MKTNFSYPESTVVDETVRVYGRGDLLKIGKHSRIDANVVITVGEHGIKIGNHCHIGVGAVLLGASAQIELGDCCSVSPYAVLTTASDSTWILPNRLGNRRSRSQVTICAASCGKADTTLPSFPLHFLLHFIPL